MAKRKTPPKTKISRSTGFFRQLWELGKRYWLVMSYTLLTLSLSITLSWVILAKQNFWYGLWHDYGGIGAAIEEFGPKNRYKEGFADTTRAERIRLFAAINRSVHRGGEGLADIQYGAASIPGGGRQLLREPEVVHLQDVAHLIDVLFWIGLASTICWMGVSGYLLLVKRAIPGIKEQFVSMLGVVGIGSMVVLLIGPNRVFEAFHIWVFPENHQWFFYYQESLMSTMMHAPHLFGWIAAAMLALAVALFLSLEILLILAARTFNK